MLCVLVCACPLFVSAQQFRPEIQDHLKSVKSKWNLTDLDMVSWTASDQYTDHETGITYTWLQQEVSGVRIFNAISSVAIKGGKVAHFASRFVPDALSKANSEVPFISADQAVVVAADHLHAPLSVTPLGSLKDVEKHQWIFGNCGIASQPITAELFYVMVDKSLRLAWNINIAVRNSSDWWNIRIDAQTGAFIEKNNWTISCNLDNIQGKTCSQQHTRQQHSQAKKSTTAAGASFNVFALPVEAPTFGPRELVTDVHSPVASPFGWQDDNGIEGPEYTITWGNNVHAYEDEADQNDPGYSPDGGPDLNFDFPLNLDYGLDTNRDAIITNLYYMNNMIHDILYHHGFNEVAGNFQENNYNNGGESGDYVQAEAQDGSGSNNANFSTPDDGNRPRMQMYLWTNPKPTSVRVNSPVLPDNEFNAPEALFNPPFNGPLSGIVALLNDGTDITTDGCDPIINAAELAGKIALMDRSLSCSFKSQVLAAQGAGAVAVIVCNNNSTAPFEMTGIGGGTTIPAVMISQTYGNLIREQLLAGVTVDITILPNQPLDASLDNGIIAHEYGHGLSNRLTGGPSASNCLYNGEQGGEGWSDWLALILTIEATDTGAAARGMATYSAGDPTTGAGIRRVPYSTNQSINNQNYGDMAASTQVHNIGEIWAQTLWDLTWKLIDTEGFDTDWYNGTGGNNTAMRLVVEGMKLQPCRPGYQDGRDAILAADALLYNNAHRCIIWEAFAGRGMGLNAVQGDSDDATDQVADFTVPNFCKTPIAPPQANFAVDVVSSCISTFKFNDLSTDLPQYWHWDFGDGATSEEQHPSHTYAVQGTYTVVLTVDNTLGSDIHTLEVTYYGDPAPTVSGNTTVCAANSTTLTAETMPGFSANWYQNNVLLQTGNVFTTPNILSNTSFTVKQFSEIANGNVGPTSNTIGGGSNQPSGAEGKLLFEATGPFILKSALVYAKNTGMRTFKLYNENNEVIQTVTVEVPDGASRVTLNMWIPGAGKYSVGNPAQNLYRNFAGAAYPYTIDNVVSIYQSNYAANPTGFYFYLYDWEVTFCFSESAVVPVTVTPGPVADFAVSVTDLTANFDNNTTGNASNFTWNFGDGSPVSTQLNPSHTYSAPGVYTVVLTVANSTCSSSYEYQVTIGTVGINDAASEVYMRIFPNPATDVVNLEWSKAFPEHTVVSVTDETGRLVLSQAIPNGARQIRLNTSTLAAGVYAARFTGDNSTLVRKFTVIKTGE